MLGFGILLGLTAFLIVTWWPTSRWDSPIEEIRTPPPDPYAESRRSREILNEQEGAPPPFFRKRSTGQERVAHPTAVRVIDGDTFVYGGQRIRIADIDTPETNPARCAHEAELGARATRRLRAWLAEGQFELVPVGRDQDRYGRKLRLVLRNGRGVGDLLVAEGLARPHAGGHRQSWCG